MVEVGTSQSPQGCWALKDSPIFESPEPVTILGPLACGIRAAGWLALGKGHSPVSSRWASCSPHDCCRWKGEVEKAIQTEAVSSPSPCLLTVRLQEEPPAEEGRGF